MNSGHRVYPGSGHPEVNSPTSCFDCITSLSGVVTVWWKKVQRELDSTLLSSDLLQKSRIQSPLHGALRALFIEGTKACRRSLALCPRRQWRLWWRRCRCSPDHRQRGTHLGRLARRALAGAVWHATRLVCPLACLCSEQARYDSAL